MVGTIDSKGIRNVKSTQTVAAYCLAGSEFTLAGQAAAIGISANGDFVAYPAQVSAGGGIPVQNGRWGISTAAVASTVAGKFVVAGAAPAISTAGTTSGNYVVAISATGSITASATQASHLLVSQVAVLGMYSSSLFSNAGGIIIF